MVWNGFQFWCWCDDILGRTWRLKDFSVLNTFEGNWTLSHQISPWRENSQDAFLSRWNKSPLLLSMWIILKTLRGAIHCVTRLRQIQDLRVRLLMKLNSSRTWFIAINISGKNILKTVILFEARRGYR